MWSGSKGNAETKHKGWKGIGRQEVKAAGTRKQRYADSYSG